MQRFFIPPNWVQGENARLEGVQAHQIGKVLRGKRGDRLVLLDDSGWEYLIEVLAVSNGVVQAKVLERKPAPPEPGLSVTIYQGLLKGKKLDWVFQKGTEIGVAAFVPLLCDRCVAL
ncbi:MAG: RsmE family RNA methyltransferase, partial [Dehalococcoidia bacterium]|nr:RsmE family RNA methyltransferase [Dehalococcoidia bacterium]